MNALDREYDFIFMKTEEEIRLIDHGREQRYLYLMAGDTLELIHSGNLVENESTSRVIEIDLMNNDKSDDVVVITNKQM